MSSIKIVLDSSSDPCYPSQTIAGKVQCYFKEQTSFIAIRIQFRGRAKTQWNETETYYEYNSNNEQERKTRTVTYAAEENYFNAEYNLVQGGHNYKHSAGHHSYPFSYILPQNLPSRFEGEYGSIRYYIKATMDRPLKFYYEDRVWLNLISPLDLNSLVGIRDPVAISDEKTMCSCWCNSSDALTFNMSLPATGFVPGQPVNVGCHVENMTNVSVEEVRFKIKAKLKFISHYPSTSYKYNSYIIAQQVDGGIGAHSEKSWTSVLNILRDKPCYNLMPCGIINISYHLTGEVVVPCPHTNLNLGTPVMIGSIPLSGVSTTFHASPPPEMPLPTERTLLLQPVVASYPTHNHHKSPSAPPESVYYPTGGAFGPSAPPSNGAPYPSGGTPYPPGSARRSDLEKSNDLDFDFGLPSYDEVNEMKDKK